MINNVKAERVLKDIHFDPETAEISMTDESQGGPASGLSTILCKSGKQPTKDDLTPEQAAKIERYGEIFSPLRKQQGDTNSLSSAKSDAGEEQTVTKGNEMSDEKDLLIEKQQKQIEALLAKEAIKDVKESLAPYSLADVDKVAKILTNLSEDDVEVITKEFKTLTDKQTELTKNAEKLANIEKEVGEEGEAEIPVEKSSNQLIREAAMKIQKGELV